MMGDYFVELVAQVEADPDNAYNVRIYRPEPIRRCALCWRPFRYDVDYDGGPARGKPRLYCTRGCRNRVWELRRVTKELVTAGTR